jgi:hypothetical protein
MLDERAVLDVTSAKILSLCETDVAEAARAGTTGHLLFSLSCAVRVFLHQDVEDNEGYNSLLKQLSKRAPHIGIGLLAARCAIKKSIGLGSRTSQSRWEDIRPIAAEVLSNCIDNHVAGKLLQHDEARWETPGPSQNIQEPTRLQLNPRAAARIDQVKWSTAHAALLHRDFAQPDVRRIICMCNSRGGVAELVVTGTPGYVLVERCGSLGRLVRLSISARPVRDCMLLLCRVSLPIETVATTELFDGEFGTVHNPDTPDRAILLMKADWTYDVENDDLFALVLHDRHLLTLRKLAPPKPKKEVDPAKEAILKERAARYLDGEPDPDPGKGPGDGGFGGGSDADIDEEEMIEALMAELGSDKPPDPRYDGDDCIDGSHLEGDDDEDSDLGDGGGGVGAAGGGVVVEVSFGPGRASTPDFPSNFDWGVVHRLWHTSAQRGSSIMAARAAALSLVPLGRCGIPPYELSLVARRVAGTSWVEAVSWAEPAIRRGYSVSIREGRAVYPTAQRAVIFDLDTTEVIHPAIGVALQRKAGLLRTKVADDILVLRTMWEASLGAWADVISSCYICAQDISVDDEAALSSISTLESGEQNRMAFFCPLCLCSSHAVCCQRLHRETAADHHTTMPQLCKLPDAFHHRLCCLCAWCLSAGHEARLLMYLVCLVLQCLQSLGSPVRPCLGRVLGSNHLESCCAGLWAPGRIFLAWLVRFGAVTSLVIQSRMP